LKSLAKIAIVVTFVLLSISIKAQVFDTTKTTILISARVRPMAFNFNLSAASEFSIQLKLKNVSVAPVFKFGLANYHVQIDNVRNVDYVISSSFVKPGLIVYFNAIKNGSVFYISESYSICKMSHNMNMTVSDYIWGTSVYHFNNDVTVNSFETEFGEIFTIYKRLKGVSGLTVNFKDGFVNPFNQIVGFENSTTFLPGAGYGSKVAVDFFIGIAMAID